MTTTPAITCCVACCLPCVRYYIIIDGDAYHGECLDREPPVTASRVRRIAREIVREEIAKALAGDLPCNPA